MGRKPIMELGRNDATALGYPEHLECNQLRRRRDAFTPVNGPLKL